MRCESGALTTVTVVETGKGQHRGAKAAPTRNTSFHISAVPDVPCVAIGIFVVPEAKKQHLNKSRVEQRALLFFEKGKRC